MAADKKVRIGFVNYYIHLVNLMRHLLGETWSVNYATKSGRLLAGESAGGVTCSIEMSPYGTTVDWQEQNFVAAIRGQRPPMCTAEDALEDLKLACEYIRLWRGK